MSKPILTIKNLTTNAALSEETACFSAVLYVDGVKTANVNNRGCGGAHEMRFVSGSKWNERTLDEACKAAYGTYEAYGMTMDYNLELLISTEVEVQTEVKSLKRRFKSKIVTLEDGQMLEYSYKGCKALTQAHYDAFAKKHEGKVVLNHKTDDELTAIVRQVVDKH